MADRAGSDIMQAWPSKLAVRHCAIVLGSIFVSGCEGIQSSLDPAGDEASEIATLFWVMVAAGASIWFAVVGLLLYGVRANRPVHSTQLGGRLILWGGMAFPSTALLFLLTYALWLVPGLRPWALPESAGLRIDVVAEQFWWRVSYKDAEGAAVVSANEIRVPVGERVEFVLTSTDVIHSFWIPALSGKMDMIPGRTNRLPLRATKVGTFRGQCAEYCGTSHALMAIMVVAMNPAAFREWLAARRVPSVNVAGQGAELFLRNGCGACHTIAGTEARGLVGPDLSHVGSRETLGAATLPNTTDAIARFIAEPGVIKPGSRMPAFGMLPGEEIEAMAVYLKGLR